MTWVNRPGESQARGGTGSNRRKVDMLDLLAACRFERLTVEAPTASLPQQTQDGTGHNAQPSPRQALYLLNGLHSGRQVSCLSTDTVLNSIPPIREQHPNALHFPRQPLTHSVRKNSLDAQSIFRSRMISRLSVAADVTSSRLGEAHALKVNGQ